MNVYVLWFILLSLYFWYFTEIKLKHASLEYDGV